jgi:hypothetical protein
MANPLEETWTAFGDGNGKWRIYPSGDEEIATFWGDGEAAATLASAAPDLYRALIAMADQLDDLLASGIVTETAKSALVRGAKIAMVRTDAINALRKARGEQ